MSENEIKPVVWRFKDFNPLLNGGFAYGYTHDPESIARDEPLYDQSGIDRLLEKIDRLEMIESSWLEFMEKTEWVQKSSEPGELGLHRADVLKSRIDRLTAALDASRKEAQFLRSHRPIARRLTEVTAERDAAVADADRYRWLRNASIEIPAVGVEVAVWEDDFGEPIRGEALDAAIDAARSEGE